MDDAEGGELRALETAVVGWVSRDPASSKARLVGPLGCRGFPRPLYPPDTSRLNHADRSVSGDGQRRAGKRERLLTFGHLRLGVP